MGSDFSYVKVHAGGQPSPIARDALLEALDDHPFA
jgi:hypothetical protein